MLLACAVGCSDSGNGDENAAVDTESGSEGEAGSEESGTEEGGGPLEGELFGLLTVTQYPEDAAGFPEVVELAAGLRSEPFEGIEDFVSIVHLQTTFAPPEGSADELIVGPAATPWSFEPASSWLLAGDGITLRGRSEASLGSSINGCRRSIGNFSEFPVYLTGGEEAPEICRSDAQGYVGASDYELVVFGASLFEDEVAPEALPTPEPFTVSAPDLTVFDLQVDRTQALDLAWSSPELDELAEEVQGRFVVRLWDEGGTIATVIAEDDGELSIPSDVLMQFEVGLATITFARETLARASLSVGSVDVVMREEHWGYLELF